MPRTLADQGLTKKLSSSSQRLAAMPEDEFEANLAQERERIISGGSTHRTQFTAENEWYTPSLYIEMAREVMGGYRPGPGVAVKRPAVCGENGMAAIADVACCM